MSKLPDEFLKAIHDEFTRRFTTDEHHWSSVVQKTAQITADLLEERRVAWWI